MTFDDHFAKVYAASHVLNEAIFEASKAEIKVHCEIQQYSGYHLPVVTMSRSVPSFNTTFPRKPR